MTTIRRGAAAVLLLPLLALVSLAGGAPSHAAALQATAVIEGTVVDAEFRPVAGCRVVVRDADSGEVWISEPTSANGRYALVVTRGARYVPQSVIAPDGRSVVLEGYPARAVETNAKIDVQLPAHVPPAGERAFASTDRLYDAFVEDARLADRYRFEVAIRHLGFDGTDVALSEGTVAIQPASLPQVEFGARFAAGGVKRDVGGDSGGFADTDLWAKIVFEPLDARRPAWAFGAVATLPTGDEDAGLGFDALRSKLFAAARVERGFHAYSLQAGVRVNEDATLGTTTLDGQVAPVVGGAWMWAVRDTLRLSVEASWEGERFDGGDDDARVLVGWTWRAVGAFKLRTALGAGVTDGAPDVLARVGFAVDY